MSQDPAPTLYFKFDVGSTGRQTIVARFETTGRDYDTFANWVTAHSDGCGTFQLDAVDEAGTIEHQVPGDWLVWQTLKVGNVAPSDLGGSFTNFHVTNPVCEVLQEADTTTPTLPQPVPSTTPAALVPLPDVGVVTQSSEISTVVAIPQPVLAATGTGYTTLLLVLVLLLISAGYSMVRLARLLSR